MPAPLIIRLSLIRLGTLMVLGLALISLAFTLLGRGGAAPDTSLLLWLGALAAGCITIAYATVTLRVDTTGVWLNAPLGARHTPWSAIQAVRVTGRRPFLGIGLTLTVPSPARKDGIDQDLGAFWGLPTEEMLAILTECAAIARQGK